MSDVKICAECGTDIHDDGSNPGNWMKVKYCGAKCRDKYKSKQSKAGPRTPEQEAARDDYNRRALKTWQDKHKATVRKLERRGRVLERTA